MRIDYSELLKEIGLSVYIPNACCHSIFPSSIPTLVPLELQQESALPIVQYRPLEDFYCKYFRTHIEAQHLLYVTYTMKFLEITKYQSKTK